MAAHLDDAALAEALLARFGDLGGVELSLPVRSEEPRPANLFE